MPFQGQKISQSEQYVRCVRVTPSRAISRRDLNSLPCKVSRPLAFATQYIRPPEPSQESPQTLRAFPAEPPEPNSRTYNPDMALPTWRLLLRIRNSMRFPGRTSRRCRHKHSQPLKQMQAMFLPIHPGGCFFDLDLKQTSNRLLTFLRKKKPLCL